MVECMAAVHPVSGQQKSSADASLPERRAQIGNVPARHGGSSAKESNL